MINLIFFNPSFQKWWNQLENQIYPQSNNVFYCSLSYLTALLHRYSKSKINWLKKWLLCLDNFALLPYILRMFDINSYIKTKVKFLIFRFENAVYHSIAWYIYSIVTYLGYSHPIVTHRYIYWKVVADRIRMDAGLLKCSMLPISEPSWSLRGDFRIGAQQCMATDLYNDLILTLSPKSIFAFFQYQWLIMLRIIYQVTP